MAMNVVQLFGCGMRSEADPERLSYGVAVQGAIRTVTINGFTASYMPNPSRREAERQDMKLGTKTASLVDPWLYVLPNGNTGCHVDKHGCLHAILTWIAEQQNT